MLLELRAENYAVIDHAVADVWPGLNLLTGETGAGKSILIDALALLLGGKASADVVRHGAEKAVVGCVFELTPGAAAILEANGIDAEADEILLRREIVANGKGRVFVNNQPATVGVLRQLAPELALVHAQGETLGAFDQAQQRMSAGSVWRIEYGWRLLRRLRRGERRRTSWRSCSRRSRIGCGWRTCGAFRARRLTGGIGERRMRMSAGGGEARAGECGEALHGGDERA